MKFLLENARKFGWDGLEGYAFNSKEDYAKASVAYIKVTGEHGRIKITKSDGIYYVIKGQGEFEIDGKTIGAKTSDVIVVPKNTPYNFYAKGGEMELFLVHVPAFDPNDEVKLE